MATITSTHRISELRRHSVVGALAAGKLMERLIKVLANFKPAGIKHEMLRPAILALLEVDRIVQGIVTIGAVHQSIGVNIPGACQGTLVFQVHARVGKPLRRDDLACSYRADPFG